jgi:MinD-like ATPase involved in chromosome partitioning or flagellar assembly
MGEPTGAGEPVTAAGGHHASAPYQGRSPSADPVADAWSGGTYQRSAPPAPGLAPGTGAGPQERAGPRPVAARPPTAPAPPRSRPPDSEAEAAAARQFGRSATLGFGRGGGRERELVRQASEPISGSRRVVVLSIKGGVGKTTTVAVVGSLLAALRRDRVVALDASSDWGTLAARLSVVPKQTVRELAARGRHAVSEHGILAQMVASPSGLYVVGSDPQSMVSAALGEEEYLQAVRLLEYVANLMIVDVGAGLQQPFLLAALRNCDQLVVATAATWDSTQSAGAALDWLSAHGFAGLVERSVVVMNSLSPTRRRRRGYLTELHSDLARRCRAVHEIPFDLALQPGGRILLRKLDVETRMAFLEVAADVVSGALAPPPAGGLRTAPGAPYRSSRPEPYPDRRPPS